MTPRQILEVALASGFGGDDAVTATAIALAESSGDPLAHNPRPPDDSYGLWQINMLGNLRASRLKAFSLPSVEALYDPGTNGRVAFALYMGRGRNFRDWSTFTNGAYLRKLPSAKTAWVQMQAEQPNPLVIPPNPTTGPAPIPVAADSTSPADSISSSPAAPSPSGFWSWVGLLLSAWFSRATKAKTGE